MHLDLLYSTTPQVQRVRSRRRGKKNRNRWVHGITAHPLFPETEISGWFANLELEIPHMGNNARTWNLSQVEHDLVKQKILDHDDAFRVQTIIGARGDAAEENPQVNNYRDKIHADYDGVVLCKEVIPEPPPH